MFPRRQFQQKARNLRPVPHRSAQNDPEATQKFQEVGEAYMCLTQQGYDTDDGDGDSDDEWEDEEGGNGRRRGFGRGGMSQVYFRRYNLCSGFPDVCIVALQGFAVTRSNLAHELRCATAIILACSSIL